MLKRSEPFRSLDIFVNLLFVNNFNHFWFWLIFCPLDPNPLIRIFLRIRIQEAKWILSNASYHGFGIVFDAHKIISNIWGKLSLIRLIFSLIND